MSHPLALTDHQLRIVLNAAVAVPHAWRSRYLGMVADALMGIEQITDRDVEHSAERAAEHMTAQPARSKVA